MEDKKLSSTYECLDCGSIIKIGEDKLMSNCGSCGSSKLNKFAGDFNKKEDYDFFQIQKDILQDIITRREEHATEKIVKFIEKESFIYTTRDDIKSEIWIYDNGIYRPNCLDYLEEDFEGFVSKKILRSMFNKYCKGYKIKGTSDKNIKVVLEDMFGAVFERKWDGVNQEWGWVGLKFKEKSKISKISGCFSKV